MTQPVMLKVYGNLVPAGENLAEELRGIAQQALPAPASSPVRLEGDLLLISFEGIHFPLEEVVGRIEAQLTIEQTGKLDALDMENWRMERYLFRNGEIIFREAPLNDVLAYSGH